MSPSPRSTLRAFAERKAGLVVPGPCLFNYAPTGRSLLLPVARLRALGYAIVLLPVQTLFAAAHAMAGYLTALRRTGEPGGLDDRLTAFADFNALVGVPEMLERERRLRDRERAEETR